MKSTMYLYLAGNNKLLTDTRLGDGDCLALYHTLKNNIYISVLDLRYNNVTNEGAKHIAQLIQVCGARITYTTAAVVLFFKGARRSSVVRAFAHGAMGRRIDHSWGGPIELFLIPASDPRLV